MDYTSYQYIALPSCNSFRIMDLLPGEDDDMIQFQLSCVELPTFTTYEVISYAWGDGADKVDCKCNGKTFMVSRNLYSALKAFRLSTKSRTLWADAIWYI